MPRNLNVIVLSWIRLQYAVHYRNTSVRDDLSYGFKTQGIDDPSNIIQEYLIQGHFIIASSQGCSHTEDHIWSCYMFGVINYALLAHFLLYFSISCPWDALRDHTYNNAFILNNADVFFILYSTYTTQYMNIYSDVSLLDVITRRPPRQMLLRNSINITQLVRIYIICLIRYILYTVCVVATIHIYS